MTPLPNPPDPAPEPGRLQAGLLTMLFEPESGFVRRVRLGQHEILRGIYVAVRNRNWGTVPPRVISSQHNIRPTSFELGFSVECRAEEIYFRWNGLLVGTSDGSLRYSFEGEAVTTFLKNRIGLCVLHPLRECCNAPVRYERADGYQGQGRFPSRIHPQIPGQSPFSQLRRFAHQIQPGCWAELEFEGDLFEMEDQRNWSDSSFKTYCTPLDIPFPVEIKAGTRLRQAITLRLNQGEASERVSAHSIAALITNPAKEKGESVIQVPLEAASSMPAIGLGIARHGVPLSVREIERFSVLRLNHLRVDLWMTDLDWSQTLHRGISAAQQLGVSLELAVHVGPDGNEPALAECGAILKRAQAPLSRVLAFRQSEPASGAATLQLARRSLRLGSVPIGGGSDAHFCELNREQALGRFGLSEADFVSWPITPQVHTFDDLSIIENLEAQPHGVTSARAFAKAKPLIISPITLRPRFNAVATSGESLASTQRPPPEVDPRQPSLFNAAWTLGSVAALAAAQAASLTYFETTGPRGLMEDATIDSSLPQSPLLFPVYFVFEALAGFIRMAPVRQDPGSSDRLAVLCLFDAQGKRRVLCANLTATELVCSLDLAVPQVSLRILEANTTLGWAEESKPAWARAVPQVCSSGVLQLSLSPYALALLDPL